LLNFRSATPRDRGDDRTETLVVQSATTSRPQRPRPRLDYPLTLAIIALALAATALALASPPIRDALVADDRIARGQLWRALTGAFVHATPGHAIRDLALVALAGVAYEAPLGRRFAPLVVAGVALPTLAVLALDHAHWYCGLSGLSHALLAAALAFEVRRRRGAARAFALAIAGVLAAKPLYELVTGAPAFPMELGAGVRQVPLAHLAGVVIGIAAGMASGRGPDARSRR